VEILDTALIPAQQVNLKPGSNADLPAVDSLAGHDKEASDASQVTIHMPVNARGVALGILAILVFALKRRATARGRGIAGGVADHVSHA